MLNSRLVTVAMLTAMAAGSARAQHLPVQGTPITFATGAWRADNMVLQLQVENPGTSVPAVVNRVDVSASPCGPTRVCAPTFDLRVRSVTAPPSIAERVLVPVSAVVENAGRTASPAVEVTICRTRRRYFEGSCPENGTMEVVPIPSLLPGQIATVTQGVTAGSFDDFDDSVFVAVVVDADNVAGERVRTNNSRLASTGVAIDRPRLELMDRLADENEGVGRRWQPWYQVRVRNTGRLGSIPAAAYTAEPRYYGTPCRVQLGPQHFSLPEIPPRAVVTIRLTWPPLFETCGPGSITIVIRDVTPDRGDLKIFTSFRTVDTKR